VRIAIHSALHLLQYGELSHRQVLHRMWEAVREQIAERVAVKSPVQGDALVRALMLTKGYAAPQTLEVAARARSLAEKGGNLADLAQQMFLTWTTSRVAGDTAGSNALAEQLLDLARQEGSPASFAFAYHALLLPRFDRGLLIEAEEHYVHWRTVCEVPAYRQLRGAADVARGIASLNAWMLGSADSARRRAARMIALAQARGDHP
jgi:hypothetical protein